MELVDDQELVVLRIVEVDQLDGLMLPAPAHVLLDRDVFDEAFMERLVGFEERRLGDRDGIADKLVKVFVVDPGVDPLDGGCEALLQTISL